MITVGISSNIDKIEQIGKNQLQTDIKSLYNEPAIDKALERGVKAIIRFRDTTEASRNYFS